MRSETRHSELKVQPPVRGGCLSRKATILGLAHHQVTYMEGLCKKAMSWDLTLLPEAYRRNPSLVTSGWPCSLMESQRTGRPQGPPSTAVASGWIPHSFRLAPTLCLLLQETLGFPSVCVPYWLQSKYHCLIILSYTPFGFVLWIRNDCLNFRNSTQVQALRAHAVFLSPHLSFLIGVDYSWVHSLW